MIAWSHDQRSKAIYLAWLCSCRYLGLVARCLVVASGLVLPSAWARTSLLSWTESTTSSFRSSKSKVPQVSPMIRPTCDPEKQGTCAKLSGDLIPHDQSISKSPDISCVLTRDKSQDQMRFGWARSLLINRWQTMGTVCNQQRHVTPVIG